MLFGKNSKLMYDLATLKHVAEILFKENDDVFSRLSKVDSAEIERTLNERGVTAEDGLDAIVQYLSIGLQMPSREIEDFKRGLSKYLLRFSDAYLPFEYLTVPAADRALRNKITGILRGRFPRVGRISDSDWTQISVSFSKFVRERCCKYTYQPETNGIIGFLMSAADFYMMSFPNSVLRSLTSVGLNQDVEGRDFGAIDYHTEEISDVKDFQNFNVVAQNVYRITDFAFRHLGEVYYDIFSRYKYKKVLEHKERIEKEIRDEFKYSGVRTSVDTYDPNLQLSHSRASGDVLKYVRPKLNDRNYMMQPLDYLLEGPASLDDINVVMDTVLQLNVDVIHRSQGGKDKRPLFDYGSYVSKDKLTTDEKLEALFVGFTSLRGFLDYLRENQVNVLSVPSAIFRDPKLIKRFPTFKPYMENLEGVLKLIEEEEKGEKLNLLTNDMVYDDLVQNSLNVINNIPLRSLRDVIDSRVSRPARSTKPKFQMPENVFNADIFARAYQKLGTFFSPGVNTGIPFHFREEYPNFKKLRDFLIGKQILSKSDLGYWTVNMGATFEELVTKLYASQPDAALRVQRTMIFSRGNVRATREDQYLTYFRTMSFIQTYLSFVSKIIHAFYRRADGTPVVAHTKFRAFLILNENRHILNMPSTPTNYTQFENILDNDELFDYFIPEGSDLQAVGPLLVKWYRTMYKEFEELMEYLKTLRSEIFLPYREGTSLEEEYVSPDPIDALKNVSYTLYFLDEQGISSEYTSFEKFKNTSNSIIDPDTGYFMRNGRLYREKHHGQYRYLHERGFWVTIDTYGRPSYYSVSKDDTFGG